MNSTPLSLLEQLRQPDQPRAWSRFVELYTPLLYHWARRAGLPSQDASDFVQDVFVVLVRQLPTFVHDRNGSFRAWLRTVALNRWRETKRRATLPPTDPAALDRIAVDDGLVLFADDEYRRHLVGLSLRLMQTDFEATTWKACWETVVGERSAADVAAELGVRVDVVYAAKYRVLRRLRQQLDGLLD